MPNTNNFYMVIWFQEFLSNTDNFQANINFFFMFEEAMH